MKLFNGDCLKVLETVEDKSVDLVIIDPQHFETAKKRIEKEIE